MNIKPIKLSKLLIFIIVTEAIGFFGSLLGGSTDRVFDGFVKPPFTPPSWLFPVAWTLLYLLIGIGAYIAAEQGEKANNFLKVYWAQLIVNALWPLFFWRLQWMTAAAFIIGILIIAVIYLMVRGFALKRTIVWFFLPYFLWLCFALYLNIGYVILN